MMNAIRTVIIGTCQRRTHNHTRALHQTLVCQNNAALAVDKSTLSRLRKQTGYAFSNCRKALLMYENDFDKALAWLREEAAKEGWAKATKLQSRPMSAGVIGVIATTNNSAVLLELNCETDFVARNKKFLSLVSEVTKVCAGEMSQSGKVKCKTLLNMSAVGAVGGEQSLATRIATEIGNIGENIQARRAVQMCTSDRNHQISSYTHTAGINPDCLSLDGCQFGRYASLVHLECTDPEMQMYGSKICQHVVGMNPKTIGNLEPEEMSMDNESGGDMKKPSSADDEDRLLHQELLQDPDVKVHQWLAERNIIVHDFVRFAVGEELGE